MTAPAAGIHGSYRLSAFSLAQLIGVHPQLAAVVRRAIQLTRQDFRVTDGIRTLAEQRKLVVAGKSWTLRSKHLLQDDDYGHAVDLVPWVGGRLNWSWPRCHEVAAAMRAAALEQRVDLRWGGVWDKPMSDYGPTGIEMAEAVAAYVERRRRTAQRAAIDGPHFELI